MMKRLYLALGGAGLIALALVATVAAADPTPAPSRDQVRTRDTVADVLGLTRAQVMELRHDGLSLGEIARREGVDPEKLVEALRVRWTERIQARVENGALTADEGAELEKQAEVRARAMVDQATMGGMHGAAVGAGRSGAGSGAGGQGGGMGPGPRGDGTGTGECDGSGPHGPGRP